MSVYTSLSCVEYSRPATCICTLVKLVGSPPQASICDHAQEGGMVYTNLMATLTTVFVCEASERSTKQSAEQPAEQPAEQSTRQTKRTDE